MVYKVFRRPSIDLDAERKTWKDRSPSDLIPGAIVPDHGEVYDVFIHPDAQQSVSIKFTTGKTIYFGTSPVYSFQ